MYANIEMSSFIVQFIKRVFINEVHIINSIQKNDRKNNQTFNEIS